VGPTGCLDALQLRGHGRIYISNGVYTDGSKEWRAALARPASWPDGTSVEDGDIGSIDD